MKVQSIDRVFDIVELLSKFTEGLSLTAISQKVELPTSTVFRLLSALRSRNYVEKSESNNVYRLGIGFVELTSMVLGGLELITEAKSYLQELSRATNQVVFLGTEQDGQVVYVDKCVPYNDHRSYCDLGTRRDVYCTALGKSLLMDFSDQDIRNLYINREMKALTVNTITNVEDLIKEVHLSKERGFAVDNEEDEIGRFCISSPVYDYRGKVIAAISTSWLLGNNDVSVLERNTINIKNSAREISRSMGYLGRVSNSNCEKCRSVDI